MQKGFLSLLILVLVFIAAFAGFTYWFLRAHEKAQFIPPVLNWSAAKQENDASPSASVSKKQTFTDQELGILIKVPSSNLKVVDESEEEFHKRVNGNFRENFTATTGYEPAKFVASYAVADNRNLFDNSPFSLWVFENPDDLTVEKWFDFYWYYPFVWGDFSDRRLEVAPNDDTTVDGVPAKYGVVNYQSGSPKYIYVQYLNKMYLFKVLDHSGGTGEQILNSFKFLK